MGSRPGGSLSRTRRPQTPSHGSCTSSFRSRCGPLCRGASIAGVSFTNEQIPHMMGTGPDDEPTDPAEGFAARYDEELTGEGRQAMGAAVLEALPLPGCVPPKDEALPEKLSWVGAGRIEDRQRGHRVPLLEPVVGERLALRSAAWLCRGCCREHQCRSIAVNCGGRHPGRSKGRRCTHAGVMRTNKSGWTRWWSASWDLDYALFDSWDIAILDYCLDEMKLTGWQSWMTAHLVY